MAERTIYYKGLRLVHPSVARDLGINATVPAFLSMSENNKSKHDADQKGLALTYRPGETLVAGNQDGITFLSGAEDDYDYEEAKKHGFVAILEPQGSVDKRFIRSDLTFCVLDSYSTAESVRVRQIKAYCKNHDEAHGFDKMPEIERYGFVMDNGDFTLMPVCTTVPHKLYNYQIHYNFRLGKGGGIVFETP